MESSTTEVYHIWGGKFMSNHGVSYRAAYVDGGTVVALFVGIPVIVENAHSTHPKHQSYSYVCPRWVLHHTMHHAPALVGHRSLRRSRVNLYRITRLLGGLCFHLPGTTSPSGCSIASQSYACMPFFGLVILTAWRLCYTVHRQKVSQYPILREVRSPFAGVA